MNSWTELEWITKVKFRNFQVTRDKKPDSWSISLDWAALSPFPHALFLHTARTEFVRPRQGGFHHFVEPKRSFLAWDSACEPQTVPVPTEEPSCSTAGTPGRNGEVDSDTPVTSHSLAALMTKPEKYVKNILIKVHVKTESQRFLNY